MKKFTLIIFVLVLSSCVTKKMQVAPVPLFLESYVLVEYGGERSVSLDGETMSFEEFKRNVGEICKASGSKNVLFGLETEFQIGHLLEFSSALKSFGGKSYFHNSKKEIKTINFN